jgi:predicted GNAT superfamily acetyltransferase
MSPIGAARVFFDTVAFLDNDAAQKPDEPMRDQEPQPVTAAEILPGTSLGTALLALNNAHAQELSWLEPARLQHLVEQAFLARRTGNLDAFLLAFDQSARYDSPNFLWFRSRYPRFVYVDRIVVASSARGRGHARALYDDLFKHAVAASHERVVCEVNTEPPNPASDAFHAALGFVEVGTASVYDGSRTVRYLSRALPASASR